MINSKLSSNNKGDKLEAEVTSYIKNDLNIKILNFSAKVTDKKNAVLGDIDILTEDYFIEVKASISAIDEYKNGEYLAQFKKYVDPKNENYFNFGDKKVILYIGEFTDKVKSEWGEKLLGDIENLGIKVIIQDFEKLGKELS